MPPKKAPAPSKKTEQKKKEKVIEVSKRNVLKIAINMQNTATHRQHLDITSTHRNN